MVQFVAADAVVNQDLLSRHTGGEVTSGVALSAGQGSYNVVVHGALTRDSGESMRPSQRGWYWCA